MAAYRIGGRITLSAPREFVITVSAIAQGFVVPAKMKLLKAESLQAAERMRDQLVMMMGEEVRASGHQVIDVEVD